MEFDQETSKKKVDKSDSPTEGKKSDRKSDGEDPKPRIVLTFRSEKPGAKSSNMKIVHTEEKHEEISPRRSNRTRAAKWDSDDDNELLISPKKEKTQQLSENDDASDSSHTTVKRSTRRQSKEFDNVIANAIARKEKSYNEPPAPTRPSRRIKPTAKALANEEMRIGLESQNNARLGVQTEKQEEGVRTRRSARASRYPVQEETPPQVGKKGSKAKEMSGDEDEGENQNQVMKLKHLCELGLKAINPDAEDSKDEDGEAEGEESEAIEIDDEAEDEEIDDDTEVISKLLEADGESSDSDGCDEDFICEGGRQGRPRRSTSAPRRSSRKRRPYSVYSEILESSRPQHKIKKTRSTVVQEENNTPSEDDVGEEIEEPAGGEEGSEAACPPEESAIIGTCFCEAPSKVYAAPTELVEPVFCQAIELVDGVRVGCSHGAAKQPDGSYAALIRAGPRAPFLLACTLHTKQLRKHMCCCTCGLFCTQGIFYQCSSGHLFHVECGVPCSEGAGAGARGCPHCGVRSYGWQPANTACSRVRLRMHCSNKRIFLPDQREQCTQAYLSFSTLDPSKLDQGPIIPADLLPSLPDLKILCEKPDIEDDPVDAAQALYDAIVAKAPIEQLVPKILSCASLNTALAGGTCALAAARGGRAAALHVLRAAGADLDAPAAGRTPLMAAVLALLDKSETKSVNKSKCNGEKETEDMEEDESKEDATVDKDATVDREDRTGKEDGVEKDDNKEGDESEQDRASDEDLLKVIRYLVAAGCDVNIPGPDGMTALHMAAQHGGAAVCGILLSSGSAQVDPRDQGGWTPLVWAAENSHHDTVRLLLANGADAAACDSEGNSVLHWCALAGAARSLQLLLDAAPAALHALNAHTDTPLHVAARQGHYACVVILLARGAKTDVENSAGELPVDVCSGQCRATVSLHMQMTAALGDKVSHKLLSSDISKGREAYPIPCINEVDDAPLPDNFTYVTRHVLPEHIQVDHTIQSLQGCSCDDEECGLSSCSCSVLSVKKWWARGRLIQSFPYHDPPMLFECNQTCSCHAKKCSNSVITRLTAQGSVFTRAVVFRVGGARGWGVRAAGGVARGAPVAAYVGELLAVGAADTRPADQYMFALDVKPDLLEQCSDKTQLCVDAAMYGGAARFMNHSCRPNLAPVRVFTHTRDLRLPIVTLFAARDIAAGEELTFDYGDKFWSVKSKWMRCECGTLDCRYPAKTDETEAS
ncbi:histone-lysine N-methyltransferase EHMT1 isoform X2 [Pectinophora gossypiella]|uniref:histone-lysine N-methyltransferase EHMT1 isoform X2 n=1 Tax=Pectinophora gossypiella TaxID=13191 RepID=UPI00214EEFCB|nr:histone-lysine N-methyltransferase EHMT1 isoform X2 [Pectinophora gossypiella]